MSGKIDVAESLLRRCQLVTAWEVKSHLTAKFAKVAQSTQRKAEPLFHFAIGYSCTGHG
jgi:hypothetical protein